LQIQSAAEPSLSIAKSGSNIQLTWSQGTLLEATNVKGPYTPTAGSPTSPYTVPASATQKFYRVSIP